jgi:hypothetical protein
LPPESRFAQPKDGRTAADDWTVEHELLAQLIEEVSVLAADHRRKKPRSIPRPGAPGEAATDAGIKHAVGVLFGTRRMAGGAR